MEYTYSTEPLTTLYQYKGLISIVPVLLIGLISAGLAAPNSNLDYLTHPFANERK
jgi:hypothetical protein